jgi:hypothetical protein
MGRIVLVSVISLLSIADALAEGRTRTVPARANDASKPISVLKRSMGCARFRLVASTGPCVFKKERRPHRRPR